MAKSAVSSVVKSVVASAVGPAGGITYDKTDRALDLGNLTAQTAPDLSGNDNDATLASNVYFSTDGSQGKGIQADCSAEGSGTYRLKGNCGADSVGQKFAQINSSEDGEGRITIGSGGVDEWIEFTTTSMTGVPNNVVVGWSDQTGTYFPMDWSDIRLQKQVGSDWVTVAHWQGIDSEDASLDGYPCLDSSGNGYHGTHSAGVAGGGGETGGLQTMGVDWNRYSYGAGQLIPDPQDGDRLVSSMGQALVCPNLIDDNVINDELGTDVSGWANSDATYTQGSEFATFSANVPPKSGSTRKAIPQLNGGNHIFYLKVGADDVSGSGVNFELRDSVGGNSTVIVTLGYNWTTFSYEQQRISMGVRKSGSLVGIAGPSVDFSASPARIAVVYDKTYTSFSLYILESGLWRFYGGVVSDRPSIDSLGISSGGGDSADAYVYYLLNAKPNIVSTGSSIVAGHNSFDPNPDFYGGLDDYNSQYQYHLPDSLYPRFRNTLVFNSGVGGEDTGELLTRLPTVISESDARLFLMGPNINDYGSGFTLQERTDNMTDAVTLVEESGATPVLVNEVYPNGANGAYYKEWWDNYRTQTGASAYINPMTVLADVNGYVDSDYVTDGVHPNVMGYQLMGEYVRDNLPAVGLSDALGNPLDFTRPNARVLNGAVPGSYATVADDATRDSTNVFAAWVYHDGTDGVIADYSDGAGTVDIEIVSDAIVTTGLTTPGAFVGNKTTAMANTDAVTEGWNYIFVTFADFSPTAATRYYGRQGHIIEYTESKTLAQAEKNRKALKSKY
jgi:lysophospholipase L1-like esterase